MQKNADEKHKHEKVSALFGLSSPSEAEVKENRELIEALVDKSSGKVSLEDVFKDLNRAGQKGVSNFTAEHFNGLSMKGFRIDDQDLNDERWYPQGITGTSDATDDGNLLGGREAMVISSYDKKGMGARITLIDTTDLTHIMYRHLLLVEPTGTVQNPTFTEETEINKGKEVPFHAGGIVWIGNYIYAASVVERKGGEKNGIGMRVFDLASIMKVNDTIGVSMTDIGVNQTHFSAMGFKYIVPEVARFELVDRSCDFKLNCLALDRSSDPPALVAAEYKEKDKGRVAIWDIQPAADGFIKLPSGEFWPSGAWVTGENNTQGAVRYKGNIYISTSSQHRPQDEPKIWIAATGKNKSYGVLYRFTPCAEERNVEYNWHLGAEDLYVDRRREMFWTPGEWPGYREVIGMPVPETLVV